MTSEARAALDRAVAIELASGAELESQAGTNAVLLKGKKVNHVLHAILSLITAGFWLIVWLLLVLTNRRKRIVLSVNERGEVERHITTV
ncbi:MAG: hypothetical protein KY392_02130 [Chloroflexi bacterium]|nr:hypothetical protein [Chloroflexota bacterium]